MRENDRLRDKERIRENERIANRDFNNIERDGKKIELSEQDRR